MKVELTKSEIGTIMNSLADYCRDIEEWDGKYKKNYVWKKSNRIWHKLEKIWRTY
jgi:hypothetical protein